MERLSVHNFCIVFYPDDTYGLCYLDNEGNFYEQRYITLTIKEAVKDFKIFIRKERKKSQLNQN